MMLPGATVSAPQADTVYRPQEDTALLIGALHELDLRGGRVLDLCTGSGAIAAAAADRGAAEVVAVDSCPQAVAAARLRRPPGCRWDVRLSTVELFTDEAGFDVVTCNPPYVPAPPDSTLAPRAVGPAHAWDAGSDGRLVLDSVCARAASLVRTGGALLLVQSTMAGAAETHDQLSRAGFAVAEVRRQSIAFGPVLRSRRDWLVASGHLAADALHETLTVFLARRPLTPRAQWP